MDINTCETYDIKEAAAILGVSHVTLRRQAEAGNVPLIQIASRRLVPKAYVEKLFADAGFPRPADD
ncbi:MAG: helix-turn-helix domain-containing protein [Candidatus Eremiobacteraeota bacterium]|nr:helix-turn-helix domain-containing protein [Candidatus Eremiobacteraeota bacterium]